VIGTSVFGTFAGHGQAEGYDLASLLRGFGVGHGEQKGRGPDGEGDGVGGFGSGVGLGDGDSSGETGSGVGVGVVLVSLILPRVILAQFWNPIERTRRTRMASAIHRDLRLA
jgi:hypothetical protein